MAVGKRIAGWRSRAAVVVVLVLANGCGGGDSADSGTGGAGASTEAGTGSLTSGSGGSGSSTTGSDASTSGAETGGTSAAGGAIGQVGDPCIPAEEERPQVAGYGITEVNVETQLGGCESQVCLVNHFQGRVSCPYGQTQQAIDDLAGDDPARCRTPEGEPVEVPVDPQLVERQAADTVLCSCRCDGPEENADYCTCPDGMECTPLIEDLQIGGTGADDLAGSYCINEGTAYEPVQIGGPLCDPNQENCGNAGENP